jgi:peroxiredoxin
MDGLRCIRLRHCGTVLLSIVAILITGMGVVTGRSEARAEESPLQGPTKGVDVDGNLCRLGEQPGTRGVVVVFLSTQCPISNAYLPTLGEIAEKYRREGIEFFGVVSDPSTTLQQARHHHKEFKIAFPVLFDGSGELRLLLAPTHTPESFVLDRSRQVIYRGAIDDLYVRVGKKQAVAQNHFLTSAIQCVIENKPCSIAQTEPVGCLMETPPNKIAQGDVTFNRDIAPIIQSHCASCHRPNRSGPFELLTYEDVCAHANQIVEVTHSRLMPPWKPEPGFAPFHDQQRLSDHEISLIRSWVDHGKAQGDPADLPTAPIVEGDWPLGEPDLILTMSEPFDIPASGPDIRQYFVIPTGLDSDRLISAIDFHPGSPTSVHHASFYLDDNHMGRKLDVATPGPGYKGFGGPQFESQGTLTSWLPGMSPRPLPEGMGRLIKRNADIVAEIHYITTGKPEQDRSKVGIYFAPQSARQVVGEIQVGNKRIKIPADNPRHLEHAYYTLPVSTLILDIVPHMHVLGTEIKVYALLPNGRSLPLLWIKKWDFDWQGQYSFMRPMLLPQGTRISVDAWFDNSSGNPLNPNSPPQEVKWGDNSTDEMLLCTFQGTCKKASDLEKLIEDQKRYIKNANPRK